MPRPRTPIGTYGRISTTELAPGVWEARARFRMRDGRERRLRRRGKTDKAAERALKKAMSELADEVASRSISGATRLARVAELWLEDFEAKVERGDRAAKSLYDYRDASRLHIVPRIGDLACREVTAGLCDEVLKAIRDDVGYASAKRVRVVLSGICSYAVRHEAMRDNPVRSVEQITAAEKQAVKVLEPEQRRDFTRKLAAWVDERTGDEEHRLGPRARAWTDLPDVVAAMLSTGVRIGEVLAINGDEIDPASQTVTVSHHLVRVAGQGIVRQALRKGGEPALTLRVPSWSVEMWRRRKLESGGGPVFATWNGTYPDPTNVGKRLSTAADGIGYGWVTSHVFRRTVATHLGDGDMPSTAIADQLGNTVPVVEKSYRRKRVANGSTATALEDLFDDE